MENSKIAWTTHTFNPWRGCTRVSEGCAHCYADDLSKRNPKTLGVWGPNGTRVVASEAMWREPVKWNRAAQLAEDNYERYLHAGIGSWEGPTPSRPRVFCASLADVFEGWQGPMRNSSGQPLSHIEGACEIIETMADVRRRLFALIDATPNLDWLILTKRPENIAKMMPAYFPGGYIAEAGEMNQEGPRPNVWLGTSVENQQAADERIPHLLRVPAAVRFLSMEPLLGPVDLAAHKWFGDRKNTTMNLLTGICNEIIPGTDIPNGRWMGGGIDWVIVGGESGHGARPLRIEWARDIVRQCKAAGVPCFVKQLGGNVITQNDMIEDVFNNGNSGWPDPEVEYHINGFREEYQGADCRIRLSDKKGGDWSEWPQDLRVREFPEAPCAS